MTRFFFDIDDGLRRTVDVTGQDLPDARAARGYALRELVHLMCDALPEGDRQTYIVTIRDARGRPIALASADVRFLGLAP